MTPSSSQAVVNSVPDELLGRTLGKYQIVAALGGGGMAKVYRAYQANLDRYVAVKVMHATIADEREYVQRFEI